MVHWKVTDALPICFYLCSWKVMNFMIFRHHNKYTHPVLYMSANTITQGMVKLKHVTNKLYTDLSSKWGGYFGEEAENTKTNILIVTFFLNFAGFRLETYYLVYDLWTSLEQFHPHVRKIIISPHIKNGSIPVSFFNTNIYSFMVACIKMFSSTNCQTSVSG